MKTPLSVHALFHTANIEGQKIYSELYKLLCRDINNPFSDGLDIPVYYASGHDTSVIKLANSNSLKKVILLFIDIHMFCSKTWRDKITELVENKDNDTLVVGVKQYKHSFCIHSAIGEIQSIVVTDSEDEHILLFENNHWEVFTTQLYDLLIRHTSDKKDSPISVFISHSKQGNSESRGRDGEDAAKEIRDFLYNDTKLNSFFDVHDILDGYKFGDQIKNHIGKCSLLILFTNTYSSREWCRIETLTAKENHVPIVAVFMMKGEVDRVFPYIGNIPSTVYDGNWRKVVNLLLRTSLDQQIETNMLRSVVDNVTTFLPYPPEALSMSLFDDRVVKVLYPEPPLGNEELEILKKISNKMGRQINFCTPMSHFTENIDLQEKKIGISIASSTDIAEFGVGNEMFKDLTIELTRHILKANGRMIYGGDLRDNGFTELFCDLARQYGQKEKANDNVQYIKNYLSWPLYNDLTLDKVADYLASRIELIYSKPGRAVRPEEENLFIPSRVSNDAMLKWATSLTQMRTESIEESDARIITGGKMQGFLGFMPGIAEEFMIAYNKKKPIFLIGGFGGCAHVLANIIECKSDSNALLDVAFRDESYKEFIEWAAENDTQVDYAFFDRIKIDELNNGLDLSENRILFHSVDIVEIVALVLKGLNKILKDA